MRDCRGSVSLRCVSPSLFICVLARLLLQPCKARAGLRGVCAGAIRLKIRGEGCRGPAPETSAQAKLVSLCSIKIPHCLHAIDVVRRYWTLSLWIMAPHSISGVTGMKLRGRKKRRCPVLKIMSTGMTALVVVIGGSSLGYAQSPSAEPTSRGATVSDLNTLTDARIAIVKAALQLTPEQEKSWSAIEDAIRSRAKDRQSRLQSVGARADARSEQSPIEVLRDRNPVEFLN